MEWTAYSIECADSAARASLVEWFEATHPLDLPPDADRGHGTLVDADGGEMAADLAWIAEYVYVLTNDAVDGLLENSADLWERAVVASFDAESETATRAVLYHSVGGSPVERAEYEGEPGLAGQGLLYRFAMEHQFRFRAYAHAPPGPMVTPAFGAFDAVAGMAWGDDLMDDFERETGVSPTARGLAFLEDDPVLDDGEYHGVDDRETEE